jgi:hypothetical protein
MAWWRVLQARVVQLRHRAGAVTAWRQPSRSSRQSRPAGIVVACWVSGGAALHRPLGLPQPVQLRCQRPGAVLQVLQVAVAVERLAVDAAGPAAPIAGLGGARTGVVGLRPAAAAVALVDPRSGREADLPGPTRCPAGHQRSPPLAWLPGSDQPTKQAGTAQPKPHGASTVRPGGGVCRARSGCSRLTGRRNGRRILYRGGLDRPVVSWAARVGLVRATKQVFRGPPTAGDNVGVRDEPVSAGHEPLLVPVILGGQPTGANGDLAAARVHLDDDLTRLPATARALQAAQPPPVHSQRASGLGPARARPAELLDRDRRPRRYSLRDVVTCALPTWARWVIRHRVRLVSCSGSGERWPGTGARRSPAAACWPASRRLPAPGRSLRCSRPTRGDPAARHRPARRGSGSRGRS